MEQGFTCLTVLVVESIQAVNMNVLLFFIVIMGLITALAICQRLSKRYHLYEEKTEEEIRHT